MESEGPEDLELKFNPLLEQYQFKVVFRVFMDFSTSPVTIKDLSEEKKDG